MIKPKALATDAVGVVLIICSILFGWLPGVGGIPLFLAGLGLLATNHTWAKKLLEYIKANGVKAANAFFREHRLLMAIYDVFSVLFIAAATALLIEASGNLLRSLAFVCLFIGTGLFMGNRRRLQRIQQHFMKSNHKR